MNSKQIREKFLQFFESKQHKIVPSAPMVIKNDPTLMFTNAGMNQFKDIFLGNAPVKHSRIADSQKCLRVSGKHNDLEEVGHDTYHHTMFEMLGNWSFGDYFKKEAIEWGWELLTKVFNIPGERLYATIFEGDAEDGTDPDTEAKAFWKTFLPEERILNGSKKDNFWEMGATGPCGPCSEIHIDLRSDDERRKINGAELVNKDHPQVIEIWNLVFIQYNRKDDGKLELLPARHVDTGMGFERLCMVVQGKQSNYDTDVFQTIITKLSEIAGLKYGKDSKTDIAMRVVADHLRTIAFSITDGQLPSNNKAGYVIRRILRRAVRYGYTFLNQNEPFMYKLLPALEKTMGDAYPELSQQHDIIEKVLHEEEAAFLRTLENGIKLLDKVIDKAKTKKQNVIDGEVVFALYDRSGFPYDLTELIAKENNMTIDKAGFDKALDQQKDRSRTATAMDTSDWTVLDPNDHIEEFIGYDYTQAQVHITRYRKLTTKGKTVYQLVFNLTPFYAESGGQVGDKGYIEASGKKTAIFDTQQENNLIVHYVKELPENPEATFQAVVSESKRRLTAKNHSATHLMHHVLRQVLGEHVEQKGSLVDAVRLRFDFSHFQKLSSEELLEIEQRVNALIRGNIPVAEHRSLPMEKAKEMGAMALFGEKYGDMVRVIQFGESVELCGGTHVKATGEIGLFKIVSESAIAAGIRRIEAITADKADEFIRNELDTLNEIRGMFKNSKDVLASVNKLQDENNALKKQIEAYEKERLQTIKNQLKAAATPNNGINIIAQKVELDSAAMLKDLAFLLKGETENLFLVLAAEINGKANLSVMISDNLVKDKGLHAGKIVKEAAKEIKGGGGGQPFFATAGGKNPQGIAKALAKAVTFVQ